MIRFRTALLPILGLLATGSFSTLFAQTLVENAVASVDQAMRNYNLISFGNASFSNNYGDTEGGLAVRGNLYLNGGAIANQPGKFGVSADPTLYVGGNLSLGSNTTYVESGYASLSPTNAGQWSWTGDNKRLTGINGTSGTLETHASGTNALNDPRGNPAPTGWDWTSVQTTFEQAAATLAAAAPTGTISVNSNKDLVFSANGQTSGVAIFTLNMADFSGNLYQGSEVTRVLINVPDDVTYVVNITNATNTSVFGSINNFNPGTNNDQLLWNITPGANPGLSGNTISLGPTGNDGDFFGSILAPNVNISNNGHSRITGQVVANNYSHSGVELHYLGFDSTVSFSPVPEPGSWGVSAIGVAFLALAQRRRRRSPTPTTAREIA